MGELADVTSIVAVYRLCAFLPLLGLLTRFLPEHRAAPHTIAAGAATDRLEVADLQRRRSEAGPTQQEQRAP